MDQDQAGDAPDPEARRDGGLRLGVELAQPNARLEPRVRLGKLDTEAQPAIAARFGIRSIPCLVLIHHGRELGRSSGVLPTTGIVDWVERLMPPA